MKKKLNIPEIKIQITTYQSLTIGKKTNKIQIVISQSNPQRKQNNLITK
jgi:hypothetical protein